MPEPSKNLGDLVAVNVMVSPGSRSQEAIRRVLSRPGVVDFEQTFPSEEDEELNRLYVLKVKSGEVDKVLSKLRQNTVIQSAEAAPKRRLIR
jgi:hypothetical protein